VTHPFRSPLDFFLTPTLNFPVYPSPRGMVLFLTFSMKPMKNVPESPEANPSGQTFLYCFFFSSCIPLVLSILLISRRGFYVESSLRLYRFPPFSPFFPIFGPAQLSAPPPPKSTPGRANVSPRALLALFIRRAFFPLFRHRFGFPFFYCTSIFTTENRMPAGRFCARRR